MADREIDMKTCLLAALTTEMAKWRWPVYHIGYDLAHDLIRTTPSSDIRWADIEWAVPAASLCLPVSDELAKHFGTTTGVPSILVARGNMNFASVKHRKSMMELALNDEENLEVDRVCVASVIVGTETDLEIRCSLVESSASLARTKSNDYDWKTNPGSVHPAHPRSVDFAANLIAYLASIDTRASALADGAVLRHESQKGKRRKPALYAQVWIGDTYKSECHSRCGGTHARPVGHLRRGHWRKQHYGAGFQCVRPVWIKPVFVNADRNDEVERPSG